MIRRGPDLSARIVALQRAVEIAAGRLPSGPVEAAQRVLDRAGRRRALSGEHTVVAFAGATGGGKSSLFNAVAGLDLARVGVRRPTTAEPLACVWGAAGAGELLDWLGVPTRHQVVRESPLDVAGAQDAMHGLVLLDLPDHDSTQLAHRLEVDRVVALADLLVWVVDPQKYADELLHTRYLKPLAKHSDVVLVVLNQIDRLPERERKRCLDDLRGLLSEDGLPDVDVLATSAATGEGVQALRQRLQEVVRDRRAADARTTADVAGAAAAMQSSLDGAKAAGVRDADRDRLVVALADSAGVPAVVDAVRHSYLLRSRQATGWPVTRWVSRFRPDPLRRLRIDRKSVPAELVRSSLPAPTPAARAAAATAVRVLGDGASRGASSAVVESVRGVARDAERRLPDRLDQAVVATDIDTARTPSWWRVVGILQWVALVASVAGLVWLGALAVLGYLQLPDPDPPSVGVVPLPTLLLLGGLVVGLLVSLLSRWWAKIGARRAARRAERQLRSAVAGVADEVVVEPVRAELAAFEELRAALDRAR